MTGFGIVEEIEATAEGFAEVKVVISGAVVVWTEVPTVESDAAVGADAGVPLPAGFSLPKGGVFPRDDESAKVRLFFAEFGVRVFRFASLGDGVRADGETTGVIGMRTGRPSSVVDGPCAIVPEVITMNIATTAASIHAAAGNDRSITPHLLVVFTRMSSMTSVAESHCAKKSRFWQ